MQRSNPPNANSHATWASSTKTLVDRPLETRTIQYLTLSSLSAAGAPDRAPARAEEPRTVEYRRMRVPGVLGTPEVHRPRARPSTSVQANDSGAPEVYNPLNSGTKRVQAPRPRRTTDSGAPQGQITLQDGTNSALLTGRAVRARNIVGDTSSPAIRIRVTASTQRTPQTTNLKTADRQATATPNIPSGSRIDKWRKDVARAIVRVPAASASPAPQSSAVHPPNLPQSSTARQPRPVRYYEYVHGPDDGISHYSSEDGNASRRHDECPGTLARNGTPYPSSSSHYGQRLNSMASAASLRRTDSVDRDIDPSEY